MIILKGKVLGSALSVLSIKSFNHWVEIIEDINAFFRFTIVTTIVVVIIVIGISPLINVSSTLPYIGANSTLY